MMSLVLVRVDQEASILPRKMNELSSHASKQIGTIPDLEDEAYQETLKAKSYKIFVQSLGNKKNKRKHFYIGCCIDVILYKVTEVISEFINP
jgi:ribonucleotide reductase beta subunit family protein with ferritin-like domain